MVKNLSDDQIIPDLIDTFREMPYVACLDIGSYDAAQRGPIWEFEKSRYKPFTKRIYDIWAAV